MMLSTMAKVAVAVAAVLVLGGGTASAGGAWTPPADTITAITGTMRSGFHVSHYDGSKAFLPTLSEAVTECQEHQHHHDRIRCTVAVRTHYRDLAAARRALRYAQLR